MNYKTFRPWLQLFVLIFILSYSLALSAAFVLGRNREPTTPEQLAFSLLVEVAYFPMLLARIGVPLGLEAFLFANSLWWTAVCFLFVKLAKKGFRSRNSASSTKSPRPLSAEIRCYACGRLVPKADVVLGDVTRQTRLGEEQRTEPFCQKCVLVVEAAQAKEAENEYHQRVGYVILLGLAASVLLAIKGVHLLTR